MSGAPGTPCKRQAFLHVLNIPVWHSYFTWWKWSFEVHVKAAWEDMNAGNVYPLGMLPRCKNEYRTFGLGLFKLSFHLEQDESLSTPELKQSCL